MSYLIKIAYENETRKKSTTEYLTLSSTENIEQIFSKKNVHVLQQLQINIVTSFYQLLNVTTSN